MDGALIFLILVFFIVTVIDIILNLIIAKKVRNVTELLLAHDVVIDNIIKVVMRDKKEEDNAEKKEV